MSTLKTIVEKLNDFNVNALEAGIAFSSSRRHYEVAIEHVLIKILEEGEGDFVIMARHFELDQDALWQVALDNLARQSAGNQGKPGFSMLLFKWLEQALLANALHYHHEKIRSIALLDALIELSPQLPGDFAKILEVIPVHALRLKFEMVLMNSCENNAPINTEKKSLESKPTETALSQFAHNLTAKAAEGKIDPAFGREKEIEQVIDVLSRRRKNNPILVGEPGVGKTAIVEGLALKISRTNVPNILKNTQIYTLDLALLQAGAGVKGEFEKRLKQVIEEVKQSVVPIILFIDEAHTLIGSGGDAGGSDAANLLKPALARGELRTIAATTWSEYKQYFERDAALERRFQVIKVEQPSEDQAIIMLNGLKKFYQDFHKIVITDAAIESAVRLSHRYITGRQLPDKAIDLLDTACAKIKIAQDSFPSSITSLEAKEFYLKQRVEDLQKQTTIGIYVDAEVFEKLNEELVLIAAETVKIKTQWEQEKAIVDEILKARENPGTMIKGLNDLQDSLSMLQNNNPMILSELTSEAIATVVSEWTGVPAKSMLKNDVEKLLELENTLSENIIGQTAGLNQIAQVIRTRRAGLGNNETPMGVFLLTGPSGVGKTETARTVAKQLFGGERYLTTINMSEYQEAHTVSQLKGSPPGYVGYGEGGILTEAVRQRPYSVVLLDEVEKAHSDVMNMFYQVFDRGTLRDGEGREIDFRNTVIFMTSNLGSDESVLSNHFSPALLARMQVIPFMPLEKSALKHIAQLKLDLLAQRLKKVYDIELSCSKEALDVMVENAYHPDRGARSLNHLIEQQIEPSIARSILTYMTQDTMPKKAVLLIDEEGMLQCEF
jgi:type VI secretion system protein VasG